MKDDKPKRENSIRALDLVACVGKQPPPRSWIVKNWIPRGSVTLLAGSGGVGKSLIAQQIATAIAANRDFLGEIEMPGSVLYLACEEDGEELWRRQVGICEGMKIPLRGVAPDLWLDGRTGLDNSLCAWHHGELGPTPFLEDIRETLAKMVAPQLLIVDNVAHVFNAGDSGENDRSKVARFLGMLAHLSSEWNIGTLLVGHPGKSIGSQYSGSTAWSDLARSRLFLGRREQGGPLRLTRPKGNYASADDDGIELEYRDGALLVVDHRESPSQALDRAKREAEAETLITRALIYFTAREETTSEKPKAGTYLPRLMIERKRAEGFTRNELHDALLRLLDADKVRAGQALPWRLPNRHEAVGLALHDACATDAHRSATEAQPKRSDQETASESDCASVLSDAKQSVTDNRSANDPESPF